MAQAEEHEAGPVEDVELEQRDLVRFERADEFRELLAVFLVQSTEPQLAKLSAMVSGKRVVRDPPTLMYVSLARRVPGAAVPARSVP